MLQQRRPDVSDLDPDGRSGGGDVSLVDEFDRVLGALRRQYVVIVAAVAACVAIAAVNLLLAERLYTSSISIMVGSVDSKLLTELSDSEKQSKTDNDLNSQVELLASEPIALKVVDALELTRNPAFIGVEAGSGRSFLDLFRMSAWLGAETEAAPETPEEMDPLDAARELQSSVEVERVGLTNVISVYYTTTDPDLAQAIAAAYGEAYLADRIDSKYAAARSASKWLEGRIEELKTQALESDLAVQRFKADNGLIAADGVLVTDQNLAELSRRLVEAGAETAKAQARFDRLQAIIESKDADALVTEALDSGLITRLRSQYLDASKRESEISARLGPDHEGAVRARDEMNELSRLIFAELGRIAQSYRSELEVARQREQALSASVANATGISVSSNEVMVKMRELEREAETYRSLHETVLKQYQEALQQTSFPIADARVISTAYYPERPSHPRPKLTLAFAVLLGGAIGLGIAGFRELRDRSVRTVEQVRTGLGLDFIGLVPAIAVTGTTSGEAPPPPHPRMMQKADPLADFVVRNPDSEMAETMWAMRLAADAVTGARRPQVVGIVSLMPGEGKSTIALNYAETLALVGKKTLLIDADLRNPGLSRSVAGHATIGLAEVLRGECRLRDAILVDPATGLMVVPTLARNRVRHANALLASGGMTAVFEQAARVFDSVVVDLAPIGPVQDARMVAPHLDAVVVVAEWGKTPRRVLRDTLRANPAIAEKCIGVVLNKVDMKKMALYGVYGGQDYWQYGQAQVRTPADD
jgi:succinoglycan biosynthesis transport protein ExoP